MLTSVRNASKRVRNACFSLTHLPTYLSTCLLICIATLTATAKATVKRLLQDAAEDEAGASLFKPLLKPLSKRLVKLLLRLPAAVAIVRSTATVKATVKSLLLGMRLKIRLGFDCLSHCQGRYQSFGETVAEAGLRPSLSFRYCLAIVAQRMMEEDDKGGESSWHFSHFSSQRFLGLMKSAKRRKSKNLVNDPFLPSYI